MTLTIACTVCKIRSGGLPFVCSVWRKAASFFLKEVKIRWGRNSK